MHPYVQSTTVLCDFVTLGIHVHVQYIYCMAVTTHVLYTADVKKMFIMQYATDGCSTTVRKRYGTLWVW